MALTFHLFLFACKTSASHGSTDSTVEPLPRLYSRILGSGACDSAFSGNCTISQLFDLPYPTVCKQPHGWDLRAERCPAIGRFQRRVLQVTAGANEEGDLRAFQKTASFKKVK